MNAREQILEEDFPASLAEVVRAIGIPAMLKLAARFGGVRVYVPQPGRLTEGHPLARLIGIDAARVLAKIRGGEWRDLPRCSKALRVARDAAIRRQYPTTSASKLALKYRLSERQVYKICVVPISVPRARNKQRGAMPDYRAEFLELLKRCKLATNEWVRKCPVAETCRAVGLECS
jgi:Mor family transcriptional regulator